MSLSVFEHPWLSGLFGDAEMSDCLSAEASLAAMLEVEAAFLRALVATGLVESELGGASAAAIEAARPPLDALRQGTAQDGVVVPALVAELRANLPEPARAIVHKGMTSQDVIDTAAVVTLRNANDILSTRLNGLESVLDGLVARWGSAPLMGRTRMQAALPITGADRLRTWRHPLSDHAIRLNDLRPRLERLQFGGAVGVRDGFGDKADAVAASMALELGLSSADCAWHAMRDGMAEYANWLSLVTGTLGKMGQDICLMAQQGVGEIALSGGGGSSAMAHKQNPVLPELLVSLARFNAVQLSGMHHALIHEQERSGAAWTLEWMILPQMVMTTGRALAAATQIASSVQRIGPLQ